jgi:hypothetical protein
VKKVMMGDISLEQYKTYKQNAGKFYLSEKEANMRNIFERDVEFVGNEEAHDVKPTKSC